MSTCLFIGPTLFDVSTGPSIVRYGPAGLGSVFRAMEAGHRRIAIVDGYFGTTPAVWHKEILYALAHGCQVLGAASMGALRAAELDRFGMQGVGRIYALYRREAWTDDDEVAVIHAPRELSYRPLSDAMANIRFTLARMVRARLLPQEAAAASVASLKQRHFSNRTRDAARETLSDVLGAPAGLRAFDAFESLFVDIKRRDARLLIDHLQWHPPVGARALSWSWPATTFWQTQFESEVDDIPVLERES